MMNDSSLILIAVKKKRIYFINYIYERNELFALQYLFVSLSRHDSENGCISYIEYILYDNFDLFSRYSFDFDF